MNLSSRSSLFSPWSAFVALLVLVVYAAGLFVNVMEVDSAQYASMSKDIYTSGDWTHLYNKNHDYLDKPPLTFWCAAVSYHIFGVNNFAFKLPSVLFCLLAVFSVYKLGAFLFSQRTGIFAAIMLATCQAFFVMNLDVKTDMYLTGAVTFTVWQLAVFTRTRRTLPVLLAGAGIGIGMLAKGPLGAMIPLLATGGDLLLRRDWRMMVYWKWLLLPLPAALLVTPFCIGQYEQFGTKGIVFFLWSQSFGRITGESPWRNNATPLYLVHNFGWAFLPWTLPLLPALFSRIRDLFRNKFIENKEGILLSGMLLTFAGLSFSSYKLPHYIFVIAPFAALLTAAWLEKNELNSFLQKVMTANGVLFVLAPVALTAIILAGNKISTDYITSACAAACTLAAGVALLRLRDPLLRAIIPAATGICAVNLSLNAHVYPELMKMEAFSSAGQYLKAHAVPSDSLFSYNGAGHSTDFYAGFIVQDIPNFRIWMKNGPPDGFYLFTDENGQKQLDKYFKGRYRILHTFDHLNPAKQGLLYLMPGNRVQLRKKFLFYIPPQPASDHE